MPSVQDRRDVEVPLRRGRRHYTTDLRFMVRRERTPSFRLRLYEFLGVDHRERRIWAPRFEAFRWDPVLDRLQQLRAREPVVVLPDPDTIIDLRDRVLRQVEG